MKKKLVGSGGPAPRHLAAMESALFTQHMALLEHMALTAYEDGDARQPGFITLRTLGSAWVFDVKDPDTGLSFRILDQQFDKGLDLVQLLLACDEAPWTKDPFLNLNGRKKKT